MAGSVEKGLRRRASIVPSGQDYEDAKEVIASLIREKVAPGLRAPTNDSIKQAYGLVIEALYEEWAEMDALREWAFGQLDRIVNAVRGEPEPLHQHSLHDVAQRVEQAMTRITPPAEQGAAVADWYDTHDAITGRDIPPADGRR